MTKGNDETYVHMDTSDGSRRTKEDIERAIFHVHNDGVSSQRSIVLQINCQEQLRALLTSFLSVVLSLVTITGHSGTKTKAQLLANKGQNHVI